MTRKILDKLDKTTLFTIETCKKDYKEHPERRNETRAFMSGYVLGLHKAGLITERERQTLYVYMTI